MLKILVPAHSEQEVEVLLHHGADEFSCALTPNWSSRRPQGGNLVDWHELGRMVERCQAASAPLFLTLDGQGYTPSELDQLVRLAHRALELGVDALIVADVALMLELKGLPLHLSSQASCLNGGAAEFYARLGVRRIALGRQITLDEIEGLVRAHPRLEFEALAVDDDRGSTRPSSYERWEKDGREPGHDQALKQHCQHYREQLLGAPGLCGLCALWRLHAASLAAIRIAGREAGILDELQLVRALLEPIRAGESEDESRARALNLRPCQSGMCYYSESRPRVPR